MPEIYQPIYGNLWTTTRSLSSRFSIPFPDARFASAVRLDGAPGSSLPTYHIRKDGTTYLLDYSLRRHLVWAAGTDGDLLVSLQRGASSLPLVYFRPGAFSADDPLLLKAAETTAAAHKLLKEGDNSRKLAATHCGFWIPSGGTCLSITEATELSIANHGQPGLDWLKSNLSLLTEIDLIYKQVFPFSHQFCSKLLANHPYTNLLFSAVGDTLDDGTYPTANHCYARNGGESDLHLDKKDNLFGRCIVLVVGKPGFTGGDLIIPELGLAFTLRPGDLIMFPSAVRKSFFLSKKQNPEDNSTTGEPLTYS